MRKGDILLNVFPKHQAEIEAYPYPARVEQFINPSHFATRLCDCRVVFSSRLHGVILSLHAGIPTIAAWPDAQENKVPDLMKDVLRFPGQFFLTDDSLTRETLTNKADGVVHRYSAGQRYRLFKRLEVIAMHTQKEYARMLAAVVHLQLAQGIDVSSERPAGGFWQMEAAVVKEREAAKAGPRIKINGDEIVGEELPDAEGAATPAMVVGEEPTFAPARATPPLALGELSFTGSVHMTLVTLVMIAILGLPTLAYRSRRGSVLTPHAKADTFTLNTGLGLSEGGELASSAQVSLSVFWFGQNQLRILDVAFFGLNYILWVFLAFGSNLCSKTYMRETRSPMALLALEGWVGVGILCAMNLTARFRRRDSAASSSNSCESASNACCYTTPCPPSARARMNDLSPLSPLSSSADPSWEGKCGLVEARQLGQGVWQAGLLHAGNAVLVSWLILIGGVAAMQALKAFEPLAAAGFSRWLLGSSLPPGRAAAVAAIVVGLVFLMVPLHPRWWTSETDDESAGGERGNLGVQMPSGQVLAFIMLLAVCACCPIAARNVFLKKPNTPPPPPPLGLLACSIVGAVIGSLALLVPWLPWGWEWAGESLLRTSGINAALCSVGYNLASFNLLSELSPMGHAVGSASKRICLFACGLYLLGDGGSMSSRQLGGALVAFLGLASYSLAR